MASAVTDLPDPDCATSARVRPGRMSTLSPSTAVNGPSWVGKTTDRSRMASRGASEVTGGHVGEDARGRQACLDRWASCAMDYRVKPGDDEWHTPGCPTPLLSGHRTPPPGGLPAATRLAPSR